MSIQPSSAITAGGTGEGGGGVGWRQARARRRLGCCTAVERHSACPHVRCRNLFPPGIRLCSCVCSRSPPRRTRAIGAVAICEAGCTARPGAGAAGVAPARQVPREGGEGQLRAAQRSPPAFFTGAMSSETSSTHCTHDGRQERVSCWLPAAGGAEVRRFSGGGGRRAPHAGGQAQIPPHLAALAAIVAVLDAPAVGSGRGRV